MPRGLPASYIKRAQRELGSGASWSDVFKRAWQIYKSGSLYKKVYKGRSSKSKSVRKVARRRRRTYPRRSYRRRSKGIPILPLAGVGNYLIQSFTAGGKLNRLQSGDIGGYLQWVGKDLVFYGTGFDITNKTWNANAFMQGTGVMLLTVLAHKVANWLGVNRMFARMKSPFNKIRI